MYGVDNLSHDNLMMQYSYYALSDPGQVRANNEDAFVFDDTLGLALLADGMGGYNAGEVASNMATTLIKTALSPRLALNGKALAPAQIAQAISASVEAVNRQILDESISNADYAGMGTTVVAGVFQGAKLVLGHVGDSRCYRLRGSSLKQITKDHSMLQEQVDAGFLTREQAAVAPGKNLLTRALGVEEVVKVDVHVHVVQEGDLFLMCSDGLSDMIDDSAISVVLNGGKPLADMAEELVKQANANGGRDNVTVLLVKASGQAEKVGLMSRLFGKQ